MRQCSDKVQRWRWSPVGVRYPAQPVSHYVRSRCLIGSEANVKATIALSVKGFILVFVTLNSVHCAYRNPETMSSKNEEGKKTSMCKNLQISSSYLGCAVLHHMG